MDAPAVAFRSMEVLLGRVDGFQSMAPFTIDTENTAQPDAAGLGNGTVLIVDGGVANSAALGSTGGAAAGEAVVNQAGRMKGDDVSFVCLVMMFGLLVVW